MLGQQTNINILEYSKASYSVLLAEHEAALKKIKDLEEEINRLKEQILLMQQLKFGKKSEAHPNTGEPIVDKQELEKVNGYFRKKANKTNRGLFDLSKLPRHKFYHTLPEKEKNCKICNNLLIEIGQDVSEQLEVLPLRLYVAEHIRSKYACRKCETLRMAPKEKAPIPKSLAGGSLLTEIIINKYQYHLPLYRQSKILASYEVLIPDNTLGQLVMQSGNGLAPILEAAWKTLLTTNYLQVDETPVKVLKPEKTGYLWIYLAPHIGKGLVIFEISLTRSGTIAENRLKNFKGLLQTDGYNGYHNLRKRQGITGLGCLSHARRKFVEVFKITNNANGIAAQMLEKLKPLYALETKLRDLGVNFHTRKRLRQKQAWPILKNIYPWLKQQLTKTPPKSKLGLAIKYTLNQWPYLIAYLRHGVAEIDTNLVENKIRPTALGKRNWLFMGHEDSGKIHALWYSLVLSAIINGLNPRVYIHYLLTQIHDLRRGKVNAASLLPHNIEHKKLQEFAEQQIAIAKLVLDSS